MQREGIKIYIFTTKIYQNQIKFGCGSFFPPNTPIQYEVRSFKDILSGKTEDSPQALTQMTYAINALMQAIRDPNVFVFMESNAFHTGTYVINPFGYPAQRKAIQNGNQTDQTNPLRGQTYYNAKRICTFDGQGSYRNPYDLKIDSWIAWNSVFYNYWYLNKDQKINNKMETGIGILSLPRGVGAFLSFNLNRIDTPLENFRVFTTADKWQEVIKQQNTNKLRLLFEANYVNVNPVLVNVDKITTPFIRLFDQLRNCLVSPATNMVFYDDNIVYSKNNILQTAKNFFMGRCDFDTTVTRNPTASHTWQVFFTPQQLAQAKRTNTFRGYSLGLINPSKFAQVYNREEDVVKDYIYVSGFSLGQVTMMFHYRYSYLYQQSLRLV